MADDELASGDYTHEDERKDREKLATAFTALRTAIDGSGEDDGAEIRKIEKDLDATETRLRAGLRLREANRRDADVVNERAERTGTPAEQHRELFNKYLRGQEMERSEIVRLHGFADKELRVQNTLVGSKGGFLVPDGFWNRLVEQQLAYSPLEPFVNVMTTATGNDLPWMTMDDTANEGELLNEGDTVSEQDLAFGTKVIRAFTYSSKLIRVSWQLLQDSVIDVEGVITRAAGIRLGRIHARHFTLGDGVNKPEGIAYGLTGGKTFAGAAAITPDELIDIQHILDPAYRTGTQRWMFNDTTFKLVRKLKDADNNYLWNPGITQGATASTILGDPYIINPAMPGPTTGLVSILYGDFNRGYIIRRVKGATAVRLDEMYATQLQTGFFLYDRVDGKKDETAAYTYGIQA